MLKNRFADSFYAEIAKGELGLALFSEEDILEVRFGSDIKVGDYLLQYRRPLSSDNSSPHCGWVSKEVKAIPPLLSENNLTSPFIGVLPSKSNVGYGFRIVRILDVLYRNEFKVELDLESVYSSPRDWSFRQTLSSPTRSWSDSGYAWSGLSAKTVSLSNRNDYSRRSHYGFIGKFTKNQIHKYLKSKTKTQNFYPLFKALTSRGSTESGVAKIMSTLMTKGCLS